MLTYNLIIVTKSNLNKIKNKTLNKSKKMIYLIKIKFKVFN